MLHRYSSTITARTLITFTRNFGTHNNFITSSPQNQLYTIHEIKADIQQVQGLQISAGIAYDTGGLYNNVGRSESFPSALYK